MKKIVVCCLLVLVSCLSIAQQSKIEKLKQLKSREDIKVTESASGREPDVLKLEYRNGKVLYKNIGEYKPPTDNSLQKTKYSPNYDSTIIDLTTIDTMLYYQKYSYWQEVPLANLQFSHIMIGDVNRNEKPELYGSRKTFNNLGDMMEPVTIYELNNAGKFQFVYQYDTVLIVRNIYDINRDGKEEVELGLGGIWGVTPSERFFSKPTDSSLATRLDFSFIQPEGYYQMNDVTLGDFDNDLKTDLLCAAGAGKGRMHIYEYNTITNTFDTVYKYKIAETGQLEVAGFSITDFDLDGKTDIVFGTGSGGVHVVENEGDNQYTHTWAGKVETYGAYIHTWTHDVDRNGKPEFWVLGDAFYSDGAKTRITLFETNGDNSYQVVGRIDLLGIFSWETGTIQAVDIDNDGVDEVAVCIDGNFLILKFNGSQGHQTYEVYYIKQEGNYPPNEYGNYYGAIMSDLLNDGRYEILISALHVKENPNPVYNLSRYVTRIYKPDSLTSVSDDQNLLPNSTLLKQNYPSPFNPETKISFILNESIKTSIKIYNVLGKEITTIVEENLSAGEHTVQWNGKDHRGNILPGGVYFIQMIAGSYQKTIKTVLLK